VKRTSIQLKIGLLMMLAVFLLLATGYLSYRNLSAVVSSIRIDYTPELALLNIREISTDLEKAENSIRTYMITNRRKDLQPYYNVISGIDEKVNQLRQVLINDSLILVQVDTISNLIEENILIWNELLYISYNDTVSDYLRQLSDRLIATEEAQKAEGGILRRVFSRSSRSQMDSEGLISDVQMIEEMDRIMQERKINREYQLAITGGKIREKFYDLITKIEGEISGLIDANATAASNLAGKTYRWLAMFSLSGTLLAILVLFIIARYVRKTHAYQAALVHSKAEAEKLARTKEIFMANMSHEIRTPVTAISGFTEQLMHEPLNKEISRIVRIIKSSSDHLVRVIDDILDFSRLDSEKLELEKVHFRIEDILRDVYALFEKKAAQHHTELDYVLSPGTPRVLLGDPYRLKQIMFNLVGNSVKFTRDGKVRFSVESVENPSGAIDLVMEFTDTGIGIDESQIKSVFEDFTQGDVSTTRRYGGTGLGLSIVKKLVELHQGSIDCQSRKNEGTTITCRLPYMKGDENQVTENVMPDFRVPEEIRKLKILVVDDEKYNRLLFKTILNRLEMEYHEAVNGVEALDAVKHNRYDLLFMDVRMPGIDGLKVTRFIRNELKIGKSEMPVVCISAASVKKDWPKYERAGMNTFLPKPFTEKMLLDTILSLSGPGLSSDAMSDSDGKGKNKPASQGKIDLQSLYRLSAGDEQFVKQMLITFMDTTDQGLKSMQEAIESGQWKLVADQAHKIMPPCRHLGATDLVDILRRIEDQAQGSVDAGALESLTTEAFMEFGTICMCINEEIVKMGGATTNLTR